MLLSSPEPTATKPAMTARRLEPSERLVVSRSEAPRASLDRVAVGCEPAVDEAGDVLGVGRLRQQRLRLTHARTTPVPTYPGCTSRHGEKFTWSKKSRNRASSLAVELDVVQMLARADLLLVPGSVAEHEPVQDSEAVGLAVAPRLRLHRRDELSNARASSSARRRLRSHPCVGVAQIVRRNREMFRVVSRVPP